MNPSKLRTIKSSSEWVEYFHANALRQREIPWSEPHTPSATELSSLIPSMRGWQLGETSDGRNLLAAAHQYARKHGDPHFVQAARLFILEEQRHGENLGLYLDSVGISRAESNWGDTLFRSVRYFMPIMEVWVTPVVMVETHALIYYNAVRKATHSPALKVICEQILADEVAHIRFQCERLATILRHRSTFLRSLTMLFHRGFFAVITLAVWLGHHRALRAGGYGFSRFWAMAWKKMRYAWRLMAPAAYAEGLSTDGGDGSGAGDGASICRAADRCGDV